MEVITPEYNKKRLHPPSSGAMNGRNMSYGSIESLTRLEYKPSIHRDSVTITPKIKEPLKNYGVTAQIAFRGSSLNPSTFIKGENLKINGKEITLPELLHWVTYYISPKKNTHLYAINETLKPYNLGNDPVKLSKPFLTNLVDGFTDIPKKIGRFLWNVVSKDARRESARLEDKKNAINSLVGLAVEIDKNQSSFESLIKRLSSAKDEGKLKEFKELLKNRVKTDEDKEKLSSFCKKNKLNDLYSFDKDQKEEKGVFTKANLFEAFADAMNDTGIYSSADPKGQARKEKLLTAIKKSYVNNVINRKIQEKQGSFLPGYGQSKAQFIARVVSGIIPAWFIANDFYNLRMAHSDDKKQARQEWKSKFGQESFRIGINAYTGYVLNNIFELLTNKSLPFSVGLNIVNTIGSNILSRVLTKRPVLPVDVNKATQLNQALKLKNAKKEGNTEKLDDSVKNSNNIDQQRYLKTYQSFRNNNHAAFGASKLGRLEKHFPYKKSLSEFKEIYEKIKQFDKSDAEKLLEIAKAGFEKFGIQVDKKPSETLSLEHIEKTAIGNNNEVIIGTNSVYKQGNNVIGFFTYPFKAAVGLGRWFINKGITIVNKFRSEGSKIELLKTKERSGFDPIQHVKNLNKWADKAIEDARINKAKDNGRSSDPKVLYGMHKNFFSPKTMDYGADQLSTVMKLTGLVSVPFLAVDAYNVTLGETKDKSEAKGKMNMRAVQDTTRQGVSFWFVNTFNKITKGLSNASLAGNGIAIGIQTVAYEAATRFMIGQPLTPTSHEEMVRIENERSGKNRNWLVKVMSGKIKTAGQPADDKSKKSSKPAAMTIAYTNNQDSRNTPFTVAQADFHSSKVADLYKKFSMNNQN